MSKFRTVTDIDDLSTKTILLRADLDVAIENGEVVENFRLQKAVNTIKYLTEKKAKVVVLGHLGRPGGEYVDELSLLPVRFELGKLLGVHIKFAHIPNSRNSIRYMEPGEVLMLENVRFHAEEESKDAKKRAGFMSELVELCDVYINDAFSSYRPHASTYDVALQYATKNRIVGMQMATEIEKLTQLRDKYQHPYVAVIGGAKIDTKIDILTKLVTEADFILLGGAMAYTFMKSQGIDIGSSKVEDDKLKVADKVMKAAKKSGCEILFPIDHVAGGEFAESAGPVEVDTQNIPGGLFGMDIGGRTLAQYLEVIKSAKTVLWNGPMGVFEWQQFSRGTEAVGEYIALSAPRETFKVAGGGDTISAMDKLKVNMRNYSHISTGGGAMLAFLAGEEMPTLQVLGVN